MNLSSVYSEFVTKPDKVRDPERLFVSDVGKCPRQVAYRMMNTEKDPVSAQALINKRIMWDIAEHLELTLWLALQRAGSAIEFQFAVPLTDRNNWGGRGDILADYEGRRVIEVKSLYPGAFNHDIDYPAHQHQALIYHHYVQAIYDLNAPALLWYVDRGGQNTPVEQLPDFPWSVTHGLMDELDLVRDSLPNMPPKLERVLVERNWKKNIVCECAWQCGRCDYTWTCEPDTSKSVWAERTDTKQPYTVKKKADHAKLAVFATRQVLELIHSS